MRDDGWNSVDFADGKTPRCHACKHFIAFSDYEDGKTGHYSMITNSSDDCGWFMVCQKCEKEGKHPVATTKEPTGRTTAAAFKWAAEGFRLKGGEDNEIAADYLDQAADVIVQQHMEMKRMRRPWQQKFKDLLRARFGFIKWKFCRPMKRKEMLDGYGYGDDT